VLNPFLPPHHRCCQRAVIDRVRIEIQHNVLLNDSGDKVLSTMENDFGNDKVRVDETGRSSTVVRHPG
jgi:hypothetical protein